MKIIIVALRRSGSTIFWKTFRNTTNATCFYEPFNPKLLRLPEEHEKQTLGELIALLEKEQESFWHLFDPIYPYQELRPTLTEDQTNYLCKLLSCSENVVLDTTRCWNKLPSIRTCTDENTFVIHLHRSPASWATSHLLPSESTGVRNWKLNYQRKRTFWGRNSDFNYWNLEDVLGQRPLSPFHLLVLQDEYLANKFYSSAAVGKLIKFWSIAFNKVEYQGRSLFKDKFISIRYEDFCTNPIEIFNDISVKTGLKFDFARLPVVTRPRPAFMHNHKNWVLAARHWDLPDTREFLHRTYEREV